MTLFNVKVDMSDQSIIKNVLTICSATMIHEVIIFCITGPVLNKFNIFKIN